MITKAIEKILALGKPEIVAVDGVEYSKDKLNPVTPPTSTPLGTGTLDSVIGYIKENFDANKQLIIHVAGPAEVFIFTPIIGLCRQREYLLRASYDSPLAHSIHFGQYYDAETFIVAMQALFVKTSEMENLLSVIGNIQTDDVSTITDDGVTQGVTVKSGISLKNMVSVPNPVVLSPFRTFSEVEQPPSPFILRVRKNPIMISLSEADGGAWKLKAMGDIYLYLHGALPGTIIMA